MAGKLYDFLVFFETLGVDVVILCYPWYISEKTSNSMNYYYEKKIGVLGEAKPSWNAFKYSCLRDFITKFWWIKRKLWEKPGICK